MPAEKQNDDVLGDIDESAIDAELEKIAEEKTEEKIDEVKEEIKEAADDTAEQINEQQIGDTNKWHDQLLAQSAELTTIKNQLIATAEQTTQALEAITAVNQSLLDRITALEQRPQAPEVMPEPMPSPQQTHQSNEKENQEAQASEAEQPRKRRRTWI